MEFGIAMMDQRIFLKSEAQGKEVDLNLHDVGSILNCSIPSYFGICTLIEPALLNQVRDMAADGLRRQVDHQLIDQLFCLFVDPPMCWLDGCLHRAFPLFSDKFVEVLNPLRPVNELVEDQGFDIVTGKSHQLLFDRDSLQFFRLHVNLPLVNL